MLIDKVWYIAAVAVAVIFSVLPYAHQEGGIPSDVMQDLKMGVVKVTASNGAWGAGTGFFIDREHIVTNCHVSAVLGQSAIATSYDEVVFEIELVGCSENADLAIYKTARTEMNRGLPLAVNPPRMGSEVYSAGHGLGEPLSPKVGIIGVTNAEGLMMVLPSIGGDSGSPILNSRGRLVAVLRAGWVTTTFRGSRVPLADRTLAVPLSFVKEFIKEVKGDSHSMATNTGQALK